MYLLINKNLLCQISVLWTLFSVLCFFLFYGMTGKLQGQGVKKKDKRPKLLKGNNSKTFSAVTTGK